MGVGKEKVAWKLGRREQLQLSDQGRPSQGAPGRMFQGGGTGRQRPESERGAAEATEGRAARLV